MPDAPDHQPPAEDYSFSRRGRSRATMLATGGWLAGLLVLWLGLGTVLWIVILLALPVIPALLDLIRNPLSGLSISGTRVEWFSGNLTGAANLRDIEKVRFDTRWDFSVRTTLILRGGKRIRLPQETAPPHSELDAQLKHRGIPAERHHFTVF